MHLQTLNLCCQIGGHRIVSDVNLQVPAGAMIGLVGVNGSGKSTLIRTLAGLRDADGGSVCINGEDVQNMPVRRRAKLIAHVGQEESPPEDLLLGEMVAMGRIPHRPPWAASGESEYEMTHAALAAVGLAEAKERRCDQLSGGERRRAMLARGIAQGCDLLLLDEPTNHLDIHHQIQLLNTVRGLGHTVIVAMHDLSLAASFFDQIVVLHEGTVLTVAEPSMALAPETLRKVFNIEASQLKDPNTGRMHLVVGPGTATQIDYR